MAQLLHEYEYVREFGEGVDRMYREMEEAGHPEPEYKTVAFMVHATIKNKKYLVESEATKNQDVAQGVAQDVVQEEKRTLAEIIIAEIHKNEKVTREQIAGKAGVSKKTVEREIKKMGNVHYVGRDIIETGKQLKKLAQRKGYSVKDNSNIWPYILNYDVEKIKKSI